MSLAEAGYIDIPQDPAERAAAWQDIRRYLVETPGLHPLTASGRKDPHADLEHRLHAAAIVQQLHAKFGSKPLPPEGLCLWVHARYDNIASSPPDRLLLLASLDASINAFATHNSLHLFNHTAEGSRGYHYDSLLPACADP